MKNTSMKSYIRNFAALLAVFLILYSLISANVLNRYYYTILVLVCISIVMSTSLNMATGFLGQLVLGHAGFMAIGAYSSALTGIMLKTSSLPNVIIFIIAALVGGISAALAGIIVGAPALRLRGDYLGIMTLGFGEVIKVIITNLGFTGGAQGLSGIPRILSFPTAFWTTVIVVTIIVLIMKSRHGRAILSIREDEIAAEAVGIPITKYKILGFAVAAFFGGVGGALYAFQMAYLAPAAFGFIKSIDIFVIVVLGGMGSLTGAILASIFLTFLPEVLREFANYRLLIYSLLLIVMMLFRPQGLLGTSEFSLTTILNKFKRRTKKKPIDGSDN
ncbi:branched-chain amino acid ABC transporter permease [Mycoplasmatota bacterium zrk1]